MPILNNPSPSNSQYVDGEELHGPARGGVPHELSFVGTGEGEARRYLIAAQQQVFDPAAEVG